MPLLEAENLKVHYRVAGRGLRSAHVQAVDGVSLTIAAGESLGLVGETGCGKSTLGRAIVGLVEPAAGTLKLNDTTLPPPGARQWKPLRPKLQMIFQDPQASLNPRMKIRALLAEPLQIHSIGDAAAIAQAVAAIVREVGLDAAALDKYPHEFSGGQRQRLSIARAIILKPQLIVADEPVSALDVSVQAQILNLLAELKQTRRLSYLFISHDLAVVSHICERVAVMYLGRIVETAPTAQLFAHPKHPYTQALLAAVPEVDRRAAPLPITGEPPDPAHPPTGCHFHPRCTHARDECRCEPAPLLRELAGGGCAACHYAETIVR